MADEVADLLREMNGLLRRMWRQQRRAETFRREMLDALDARVEHGLEQAPSFDIEAHEQRIEELQREAEQQRQEERAFREDLLLELRRQSALLVRMVGYLERAGGPDGALPPRT
jgi:hypothetical protein